MYNVYDGCKKKAYYSEVNNVTGFAKRDEPKLLNYWYHMNADNLRIVIELETSL